MNIFVSLKKLKLTNNFIFCVPEITNKSNDMVLYMVQNGMYYGLIFSYKKYKQSIRTVQHDFHKKLYFINQILHFL